MTGYLGLCFKSGQTKSCLCNICHNTMQLHIHLYIYNNMSNHITLFSCMIFIIMERVKYREPSFDSIFDFCHVQVLIREKKEENRTCLSRFLYSLSTVSKLQPQSSAFYSEQHGGHTTCETRVIHQTGKRYTHYTCFVFS